MSGKSFLESISPRGYLEVIKRYLDGTEEIVFSDYNMITVGMGNNLAAMFGSEHPTNSLDSHRIKFFQLGNGGETQVSSDYGLTNVFTAADYGSGPLTQNPHNRVKPGSVLASEVFIELHESMINRPAQDQIQFVIDLDTDTANGEAITEIGLFANNPYYQSPVGSVMCAYRYIPSITKSSSFALTFKWTIEF